MLANIAANQLWDFIIVGGGASGLGIALEAASRGYRILLLEKHDFAQETSSRSTKLIHGGIRYLRSGQFSLVRESLQERSLLMQNAPHLVHPLSFILPTKGVFHRLYYYMGIKLYDFLAGRRFNVGISSLLSKAETYERLPTLKHDLVDGGIEYFDGQFDDSRLAINLAQTIVEQGGTVLNYMPVLKLLKQNNKVIGVVAKDLETAQEYEIKAKVVINATGAFADTLRQLDEASCEPLIVPSQGTHIILKSTFFPGDSALIIPQTKDGRVLFFIPWKKHLLVGTTETPLDKVREEPVPFHKEIEYLLEYTQKFLTKKVTKSDILSAFAGIRPLVKLPDIHKNKNTSELSRDYRILISDSHLISVLGGKWTSYRKMGQDTIDQAVKLANLPLYPSITEQLPIHGFTTQPSKNDDWFYYGDDAYQVEQLANHAPEMLKKMHPDLSCRPVDVVWAVQNEMARNVEDVLARRTRSLLLGAKASVEIASMVASIMAKELGYNRDWEKGQVQKYSDLAKSYIPN